MLSIANKLWGIIALRHEHYLVDLLQQNEWDYICQNRETGLELCEFITKIKVALQECSKDNLT